MVVVVVAVPVCQVGHNVVRVNYLGDWGTQFGLLLAGLRRRGILMEQVSIKSSLNEYGWTLCCQVRNNKDPVAVLLDVYIEANRLLLDLPVDVFFSSKMSASKGWQLTMRSLPVRLEMLLPS